MIWIVCFIIMLHVSRIICLFFVALMIASCDNSQKEKDTILIAMSMDYPPFEYIENGDPVGLEIDLAKEIGRHLNKKVKFIDMDFGGIMAALQYDKADIGLSAFSVTEQRKKVVDFIAYPYKTNVSIVYKKNSEPKDLNGKIIGLQLGSTMEQVGLQFASKNLGVKTISLNKNLILLQELKLNRIDVIMIEEAQAVFMVKTNSDLTYRNFMQTNDQYAIALPKNSPLKPLIEEAIHKIEKEGKYNEIYHKWFKNNN